MRAFLIGICTSALLSWSAVAGPQEDALAVLDKWAKAFAASDVDAIVALYAPDALFMGTGSKTVVKDPAAIRKYFEDAILTRRPRAAPISSSEVMVLSDGFSWDGKTYKSLSKVACAITGSRWNGPRFFGLRDKSSREART